MKRIIFYSWQSDLDSAVTRNFIEEALNFAARKITRDEDLLVEPVVDRDTAGIAGAPGIAEAIMIKIARSDVFVADVSIVNSRTPGWLFPFRRRRRLTPNPNVLVELGFAIAHLGWERIVLVQNTSFGDPETLPFDLRGRRIVPYALGRRSERGTEKGNLRGRLESAVRLAITDAGTSSRNRTAVEPRWWGTWRTPNDSAAHSGKLFIRETGARGFLFHLLVTSGAHVGTIAGVAQFAGPYSAYAQVKTEDPNKYCELSFRKSADDQRETVVNEAGTCHSYRGIGAAFVGRFVRQVDLLFDLGFLDELDLARLYSITGQYYESMCLRFAQVRDGENDDRFLAEVIVGGVGGFYTIMEGIVMRGEYGQLWAAFIDEDVVRYFTTEREYKQKLPVTIETWRERFKDKPVIFDSPVDVIPASGF